MIDERSRHALYLRLEHVLGPDEAGTLMEHLPPMGWADVVTRRDLAVLRTELGSEIASGRAETCSLRSEMRTEFRAVRSEMQAREQSMTGLFRSELAQAVSAQTRTMVVTMITLFVTGVSLAFASARLG